MATTYYNDIQKLYVAYFNRPADAAGLAYYEGVLEAAKGDAATLAKISADFAKSTEYTAAFTGKTSAEIVDIIYTNIFGHAADDAGRKFYADNLDANKVTLADVVTEVAKGAQGTDLTAYNSKLAAAAAFSAAVDTDAEKAGYSGEAANKVAKTFLAGVTDALTLAAATSPTALNSTVAAAVAAGTPFSVTGTLAQVTAATKAVNTFVTATVTKDVNGDGKKDAADIDAAKTKAVDAVAADMTDATGAADTAVANLYKASTTSAEVRAALVANQQTINAKALNDAQTALATANSNIAKVAGLGDAASTLAAAKASLKAAGAAETAARADLVAKQGAFGINNDAAANAVTITSTELNFNDGTTTTKLATIDANGKATLATGVTASDYVGLTELISAINAEATASANVTKATDNVTTAQLGANLLDVAADTAGTITVATGAYAAAYSESSLIAKIASVINGTTPDSVATGATPTLAQIQTELAVLKAAGGAAYTDFKALVDAEAAASSDAFNPLIAKQTAATDKVSDVSDAIADLAKDVAALQTASANADTLAGLNATVDAYNKVLKDKGYTVVTLDATHTTNFAGATSDVYVVSNKDASIGAFGLQGTDQLFVGTGYSLVQGAIGATGVKGNDAALEIFVSNNNGDTVLQIETHAYSSAVTGTGTGEIVTITLTGVDASHIKLDANGIITAPAA